MSMLASQVARSYAHSAAMTAGHLKAHQMLLERGVFLIQKARRGDLDSRNRAQDIVAQLQSSLQLRYEASQHLFEVLGYVWDALEWNEGVFYDRAEDLLRQIREVVVDIQKK